MGLVDTHAHLDHERFDSDREQIIGTLKDSGVDCCITIADSVESSRAACALAQKHEPIYAAAGVHPHNAGDCAPGYLAELEQLLSGAKAAAVGEIGLDYHYDFSPREAQKRVMLEQIALAGRLGKPVVFHVREAWGDFLALLRAGEIPSAAVLHSFSGSIESLRECLDRGMMVSFTGIVTFKNAKTVKEAAVFAPADRIMVETDCPYMTPEPFRGKRCEPAHVRHTAEYIAALRGMDAQEFFELTSDNARRFFGIAGQASSARQQ